MTHSTLNMALVELQHSVRTHIIVQAGPNPQLCVFLVKLLDIIDDLNVAVHEPTGDETRGHIKDMRLQRVEEECRTLAFCIIESLAVWLATSMDNKNLPAHAEDCGKQLLVLVAKARALDDKIAAKTLVLYGLADAMRVLKAHINVPYPDITDSKNNVV